MPAQSVHSLQMEIGRGLFLNEKTNEPSANFANLTTDLTRLARGIADFTRGKIAR